MLSSNELLCMNGRGSRVSGVSYDGRKLGGGRLQMTKLGRKTFGNQRKQALNLALHSRPVIDESL